LIKKLTTYYGLAIRRNVDSVTEMKKAILSTYYHMCSTKENPRHEYCPPGAESWCEWKKAEATKVDIKTLEHPAPLHPDLQKHLYPIYEDLSKEDLLERCLGGHTQNANESFNSTVWRLAPKHMHSGLKIIEIAAYLAAGIFNEGNASILRVMNTLGLIIGKQTKIYADNADKRRIQRQEWRSFLETKEARKARKEQLLQENRVFEEAEGLLYGPGIAD